MIIWGTSGEYFRRGRKRLTIKIRGAVGREEREAPTRVGAQTRDANPTTFRGRVTSKGWKKELNYFKRDENRLGVLGGRF